jgi:hypothetical protein
MDLKEVDDLPSMARMPLRGSPGFGQLALEMRKVKSLARWQLTACGRSSQAIRGGYVCGSAPTTPVDPLLNTA